MKSLIDAFARFNSADGDGRVLRVRYANRGDPYRQGVTLELDANDGRSIASIFLDEHEAQQLRDLLKKITAETA